MATYQTYTLIDGGGTADTSLTINLPTGTVAGNLLLLVVNMLDTDYSNTPSGWTKLSTVANYDYCNCVVFYKIADSTLVSAGSVTVTFTSASYSQIALLRISGQSTTQPVGTYSINPSSVDSDLTPSINNGITPYTNSLLFMITIVVSSNIGGGGNTSGYGIATDNPSWTEIFDAVYNPSTEATMAIAYANRTQNSATGNSSFITTTDIIGLHTNAILVSIPEDKNFTISETSTVADVSEKNDLEMNMNDTVSLSETLSYLKRRVWTSLAKPVTAVVTNISKTVSNVTNQPKIISTCINQLK